MKNTKLKAVKMKYDLDKEFPVITCSRRELEEFCFDTSHVKDKQMKKYAKYFEEAMGDFDYKTVVEEAGERAGIPMHNKKRKAQFRAAIW